MDAASLKDALEYRLGKEIDDRFESDGAVIGLSGVAVEARGFVYQVHVRLAVHSGRHGVREVVVHASGEDLEEVWASVRGRLDDLCDELAARRVEDAVAARMEEALDGLAGGPAPWELRAVEADAVGGQVRVSLGATSPMGSAVGLDLCAAGGTVDELWANVVSAVEGACDGFDPEADAVERFDGFSGANRGLRELLEDSGRVKGMYGTLCRAVQQVRW